MRKVEPLTKAPARLFGVGDRHPPRRGFDAGQRAVHQLGQGFWTGEDQPIAAWTDEEMQTYIDANDVLVNPLGFELAIRRSAAHPARPSPRRAQIRAAAAGQASTKTECGLHASAGLCSLRAYGSSIRVRRR